MCQICEAPQVLVEIMAEIVRRQKFTESFAKVVHHAVMVARMSGERLLFFFLYRCLWAMKRP